MNMKILPLIFLVFVFSITSAIAADLRISLDSSPYPCHANDVVELEFRITNENIISLNNITFSLDAGDPFTMITGSEQTISLATGESRTITYKICVDGSADEGNEKITLDYKIGGTWDSEDFEILIAPRNVYLQITDIKTTPEQTAPGESANIAIKVKNTAESEIKDLTVTLKTDSLPFALKNTGEQHLESLGELDEKEFDFNVGVLADAEIKTYKIPLSIEYYDSYGNRYEKNETVSFEVYETPKIELSVEKNELVIGMPSKLTIKVLNKGLGNVLFSEINALKTNNYDIENSYEYIGKIESDDYDSVEFTITPKKQDFAISFTINYRDSNNKEYSEVKSVNVHAYGKSEAQRLGIIKGFPWAVVISVLVVIALVFVWRAKKRKKRSMQSMQA